MAQTITDFNTFLKDARDAVLELNEFSKKEDQLRQEEDRLEKALEAEKKAVEDAITLTVKKRREEIISSYDNEIAKQQDKLKKVKSKREKAKNQGIRDRIKEETLELDEYNRELRVRMRTLFQKEHVPGICGSRFYYALYFTRGFREFLTLFLSFFVCFLLVPYGLYMVLPEKEAFYLVFIYIVVILVFGGLYTAIGNITKGRHLEALREGRTIRNLIVSNNRKIRVITGSIKKDKNETLYNLEKYDDDITQLEHELAETAGKKKDALNSFENVTKTIIADEISGNSREKIEKLTEDFQEVTERLRYTETIVKEKKIFITNTYETYLGKEFLRVDHLDELRKILESGEAANISEAIEVYRNRAKK